MSRFRCKDKVEVNISELNVIVQGTVEEIQSDTEGSLAEVKFLVKYDTMIDGKVAGLHTVDEMRLIHGAEDIAPPSSIGNPSMPGVVIRPPLLFDDYHAKVTARLNTAFDALYCKSETKETWLVRATTKGRYLLRQALLNMSLKDIYDLYGALQAEIFGQLLAGGKPERLHKYRVLSLEILHACMMEGCFQDNDGKAIERFRNMLDEYDRPGETGEGEY